jgi:hypothetical protein
MNRLRVIIVAAALFVSLNRANGAECLLGMGAAVSDIASERYPADVIVHFRLSRYLASRSFLFTKVDYIHRTIEPSTLADGGALAPFLLEHYAADVHLVPLTVGVGLGKANPSLGPFVEGGPSLVWSRWDYDDMFFSVLSYVRVLVGYQVSGGLHVRVGEKCRLGVFATRFWSENSTSEKLDPFGSWSYPGYRKTAVGLSVDWQL